ncbi:thiosulfate/3-mercaptopyruvate sulfurtransferase [Herbaspirillum sp. Sphag1AN]|uniref:sulfurtransferase n=1 Tax=unclassified Herbaspirillum TaxID=2624150 RepID=UPI00161A8D44|nr:MULTISPECIES: sulfurtransferase [unclassified Herbaspirillum]MBB3214586.1 thiosulfate/3-mercaptopyruvate sulfurtransferase [Herbaspirillum sp. Sphag1AN]MBB3247732.1 thiosulfate/3-mercaptopyruvate sulfurtransferase [Herbaspirillum sp. Sphag64]
MAYTTLISAAELATHSNDSRFVIVDCRHDLLNPDVGPAAYSAGHIAGARFAHLDKLLSGTKIGIDGQFKGRHPLPQRQDFIAAMQSLGINNDTQVIAYDAVDGRYAARLWWLLRWVGHAQIAVLDGGLQAWQTHGGAIDTSIPEVATGNLEAHPPLVESVDAAIVLNNISEKKMTLVDARSADRYRGENETIDPVGGHIPGAKNRFFLDNLESDGRFKPAAALRSEWNTLLEHPQQAIMQCGSGVTACHNLLALEIAGLSGAKLYPGSWSEWCAEPSRPVATGPLP